MRSTKGKTILSVYTEHSKAHQCSAGIVTVKASDKELALYSNA